MQQSHQKRSTHIAPPTDGVIYVLPASGEIDDALVHRLAATVLG